MADKFEYNYNAPTPKEQEIIKNILAQYEPKNSVSEKVNDLKKLDFKVKKLPTIFGYILGISGILVFGLGLTMILEWNNYILGSIISTIGLIIIFIAYPIYKTIYKKMKDKYSDQIIELSRQLLDISK